MSVKDFISGMYAGAKPYKEVYKKQEAAIRRVSEELGGKLNNIHVVMNDIIEDMDDIKRKELYDLNTPPVDLKSFDQEEKEYLVAGIYTLASMCKNPATSPFQKEFARSIQSYLGITNPQIKIDLSKINSIDSVSKQSAIMQVFMEYLFLEKEDFTFLTKNEYADCFKNFNVNEKKRDEILKSINNVYNAVDSLGFIEKYSFVFDDDEKKSTDVEHEKIIDIDIHIPPGKTEKYHATRILLNADIRCEGDLIFDHCIIIYNGNNTQGRIYLEENSSFSMSHCVIFRNIKKSENTTIKENREDLIKRYVESSVFNNEENLFYDNDHDGAEKMNKETSDELIEKAKIKPTWQQICETLGLIGLGVAVGVGGTLGYQYLRIPKSSQPPKK